MTNRLKSEMIDADIIQENVPENELGGYSSKNFFTILFTEGIVSKETATTLLPFILYVAVLMMIYIGSRHYAEKNVRKIDQFTKEVKELSWDYKTLKAELMLKTTQTEIMRRAGLLGLKQPAEPPRKVELKPAK